MEKTPLGKCEIQVSRMGLGTVKFGRTAGLRYPSFKLPEINDLANLLSIAAELGVNLLDTAHAYGESESRLGKLLKGNREKWILSTKSGEIFKYGQSSYDFRPEFLETSLHSSLKKLKTEYIDIFLLHCNANDTSILMRDDVIETMNGFKNRGMARAIGVSTNTVEGGMKAVDLFDVVMVAFNPQYREQQAVIDYAKKLGKGVLIKKPLDCGYSENPQTALQTSLATGATSIIVGTIDPSHLQWNAQSVLHG